MKEENKKRNQEKEGTNRWLRTYEIFDRRHIHDEELLISRTGNFMLVNSFLFVAFATLVANEIWFSYVFSITGIVICLVFYPLFWMQLKTARLWLETEDEMEEEMIKEKVFPVIRKEEKGQAKEITIAPNQRHNEMTRRTRWMWPIWFGGPVVLVSIMLAAWIALLIIAC